MKYFINNNSTKSNPKKTEILNLFSTFITTQKSFPQLKPKKAEYPFTEQRKTAHKAKINIEGIPVPFNDESLLLDQCLNFPSKVKSLNYDIKKSNIEQIKNLILPSIRQSYESIDFIRMQFASPSSKNKISYIAKEISENKFNSPKLHEIRSNYFIKRIVNENKTTLKKIKIAITDTRTPEEIEESYDSFVSESLQIVRLKKIIKNFLCAKDNKLNQIVLAKDKFFDSKENKVNFMFDIYQVPTFKNNFINYSNKMENLNQYKNVIDQGINRYLNLLKYSIQKKKDNLKNHVVNEKEIEEEKKLKKLLDEDPNDNVNFLRSRDRDKNNQIYEIDNFFIHKYSKYQNVRLSSDKIKNVIFYEYKCI